MKKLLSMLLVMAMVLTMMPAMTFAVDTTTISFETDFTNELAVGDSFTVTAYLANNPGMATITLSLDWNENAVQFDGFAYEYDEEAEEDVMVTDVFKTVWSPVVNDVLGIINATRPRNTKKEGKLFVANFTIVGEGELGIGLKNADETEFQIRNENSETVNATLDFTAVTGLTVGGVPVGPEMPEDAPFTNITTDAGPIVDVQYVKDVEFNYGDVPYYIVTIPADATTAFVTAPDQLIMEDWTTMEMMATGYAANFEDMSSPLYISYNYEDTADGPKVEIPMYMTASDWSNGEIELCFVADEYNDATHAFGIEDASNACLGLISFVYDDGKESYPINVPEIEGGSVVALNEEFEEIITAKEGELVRLEVTPDAGYKAMTFGYIFEGRTYDCPNYCFDMPAGEVTLFATFKAEHTCQFAEVVAPDFLKSEATCQHGAVYYKSCACGAKSEETFVSGNPVDHSYVDRTCEWCGAVLSTNDYTVTMGQDVTVSTNDTFQVTVTIGHNGQQTHYNAFDLTFTYDPTVLRLVSTSIEGMTVTVDNGKIRVQRYGAALENGVALTLTFSARKAENTSVKLLNAQVDISANALENDAPAATIVNDTTHVTVCGYMIHLPEDFEGDTTVRVDEDYTFVAKDLNYNYVVKAFVGEQEITVVDNGDGTYTIKAENISGDIVVTAEKSGKTFGVTLGDDLTGAAQAQYMTAYTATLTKVSGFGYTITVTIGGTAYTGFTYDEATGMVTIPGEAITGDVVINTGKEAGEFTVTFDGIQGVGAAVATGAQAYSFTIEKQVGYIYTVTATMGGQVVEVTEENGTYTIANVTGDVVISIVAETDLAVEVEQFVKLDGKAIYLITATQTLAEGKALSFDGTVMFYSQQYEAWCYLVIAEEALTAAAAKEMIVAVEATYTTLEQTCDVNGTGKVDINDAQLVFDMYNNVYQDFAAATMLKFLNADVNGDKTLNVQDAAAIVAEILEAESNG